VGFCFFAFYFCLVNSAATSSHENLIDMSIDIVWALGIGIFLVALLYSCVGHAGASGYIAIMTLLGLTAAVIKPTALTLNILVASIASVQFLRAKHFSWRLFWPLGLAAVPFAFLGGYVNLPSTYFKMLLGVVLLYSAWRMLATNKEAGKPIIMPGIGRSLFIGAMLGLLSGLTGTGGGIFLTPLILLLGWAGPKTAAGVSAVFILVNSTAGLAGNWASTRMLPEQLIWFLLAAGMGGLIGSQLGSQKLPATAIKRCLAVILTMAGFKLLLV
jgi:uncharacterized protein